MLVTKFDQQKTSKNKTTSDNDKFKKVFDKSRNSLSELMKVMQHVNENFLKHPYDPKYVEAFPKASKLDKYGVVIYRPNHGLAHTLRAAYLVPMVAEYLAKYSQDGAHFNFSHKDILKIQSAMLFFVVGRENEMSFMDNPDSYAKFRRASSEAFKAYAKANLRDLFENDKEIERYAKIVYNCHDANKFDPVAVMLRQCHNLDLVRCYDKAKFDLNCRKLLETMFMHPTTQGHADPLTIKVNQNAIDKADELIDYASRLIKETGNRIPDGPYAQSSDLKKFEKCSKNINYCINTLNAVKRPDEKNQVKLNKKK